MTFEQIFNQVGLNKPALIFHGGTDWSIVFLDEKTAYVESVEDNAYSVGVINYTDSFHAVERPILVDWIETNSDADACLCIGPPAKTCPTHGGSR